VPGQIPEIDSQLLLLPNEVELLTLPWGVVTEMGPLLLPSGNINISMTQETT